MFSKAEEAEAPADAADSYRRAAQVAGRPRAQAVPDGPFKPTALALA